MCSVKIIVIATLLVVCSGQFTTPRYRPFRTQNRYSPGRYTGENAGRYTESPGKYRGNNDGRYIPDPNAGKYIHKDDPYKHINVGGGDYRGNPGRYVHDPNSGKYIHIDDPYKHKDVGGGQYSGSPGQYVHDPNSGKYIHIDDPYKHKDVGGGQYSGSPDKGTGGGYYKAEKDKQYPYKDGQNSFGESGKGKPSRGDYGRHDEKYDIIHHARKGYKGDNYFYTYETENGILAEETSQDGVVAKDGSTTSNRAGWYEYTGPDGKLYHVDYVAGENGFEPKADFIPTIPPLIQKALDYLKAQENQA